ncbi:MAG: alpha/beta hydrolase [Myxococcota bacterium]
MGRDEGFFSAKDNLRLFWETTRPSDGRVAKAHVGIVHGYADHAGRYRKTIDALAGEGFVVHAFDYRGHGQADGRRGHCDRFEEYVDDLERFWQRVREAAGKTPAFLLAHSHGALMTLHFLRRRPEGLRGTVLSAPYLKLAFTPNPLQVIAARAVGVIVPWLPQKMPLAPETLTRDTQEQHQAAHDPLYNRTLTVRWFVECTRAQAQATRLGPVVTLPVFTLFGSEDAVASPTATRAFFDTIASNDKKLKEYPGMRHEPLNEIGREEVWRDISGWISAHL